MVLSQLSKPIEVLIKIQHHIVNKNTWNKKDSVEGQPPAFQMVRKEGCFLYGDVHMNKFEHTHGSQDQALGDRGHGGLGPGPDPKWKSFSRSR